jgi:hypothetical protein
MSFPGVPAAFGGRFFREDDELVNQVDPNIFVDDPNVGRLIVVVVYNHLDSDLFFITDSFGAGGFTPAFGRPDKLASKAAGAYRLQSEDGAAVDVTVQYGLSPDSSDAALKVTISAPDGAGVRATAGSAIGFDSDVAVSPGDHCQVDIDLTP